MRILLLDNYDSFTYNLQHYLQPMVDEVAVIRNDVLDLDAVDDYDAIVLSPGPGLPADAGCMPALLQRYASSKPILGVCLGLQALAEHFGAQLLNLPEVLHGRPSAAQVLERDGLFAGCEQPMIIGHYHSWVVDAEGLPDCLQVTALHADGYIMALRHRSLPLSGVQFHPESILTPDGRKMLSNWVDALSKQ